MFAELYPQLRRFAAVVAPVEIDPDDLVQDALERTLRVRALSSLSDPRAYLLRVVVNLASNQCRGLGRARRAMARLAERDGVVESYQSDVSELLRLPVRHRTMLFLREVEGFSCGEIGALLGMSSAHPRRWSGNQRMRLACVLPDPSAGWYGPVEEREVG